MPIISISYSVKINREKPRENNYLTKGKKYGIIVALDKNNKRYL